MEHFDQLREKFYLVKEKVEICSRKCSFLEERLRTLNVKSLTKTKAPRVRAYKPKKVVGKENSFGVYEDEVQCGENPNLFLNEDSHIMIGNNR